MLKRHEIQVLLKAGHSQAEVAALTGASIRSVKRVAKEEGMLFLRESALGCVFDGTTTLREINKVTFVE